MTTASILPYIPSFVKIVELQSFSKAALALGVTKSAVSKQMQALEDILKIKLIHRTTRTIRLTDEGEAFFTSAKLMVEMLDEATSRVQDMRTKPSGMLTINAPEAFGLFHLAPALAQFAHEYQDIKLHVTFSERYVNILEEGVDIAIRIGTLTDSSLMAKKLAPCQIITAAAPEYLQIYGTPTHPDQLAAHRFIAYAHYEKPNEFHYLEDGKEKTAFSSVYLYSNNGQMMRQAALSGLGIISMPSFIIGNDIKKGKLVPILEPFTPTPERNIYAIFPPNRYQSTKVRTFLDFLSERFSGKPYWEI